MTGVDTLEQRLHSARTRIERAAESAGRKPDQVRLIAVSKGQSTEKIRQAYAAGQRDFGESYVQELQRKAADLADLEGVYWHFIGHLQRNKARHVVKVCHVVHSIDSVELANELATRLRSNGQGPLSVLVEVNVGHEPQKHGVLAESLEALLHSIEQCPELALTGLMTIPPNTEDPAASLGHFNALYELRERHGGQSRLPELSMGMSDDAEYAIQAGATWVRMGTAIFGPREAK